MSELIQVSNLRKSFVQRNHKEITILRDIDFTIGEGETLCVLGESGCGKTTLGKILAGLQPYSEGSYLFRGKEVSMLKKGDWNQFRSDVQMIHQNPYASLNPTMMVFDIIANPIRRKYGIRDIDELYARVTDLLRTVCLTPVEDFVDKYPDALSGGQRQRVSIARILAMDPKLIVVDEATSMIDTSLRISLLQTLLDIQMMRKVSYFFITHDIALGRFFARRNRVMVMYLGKIVEIGDTDSIVTHPAHPYTKALISAVKGTSGMLEKADEERYLLKDADIPSFSNLPEGCLFHPRCPECMEGVCNCRAPELVKVGENHFVSCSLYREEGQKR